MYHVDLNHSFRSFVSELNLNELVDQAFLELGISKEELRLTFVRALTEAEHTIGFVGPNLVRGKRMLEVGSGTGLLGVFLIQEGFDLWMLEPGEIGFTSHTSIIAFITRSFKIDQNRVFRISIQELPTELIPFEFIFSNNVLEHVNHVEATMQKLSSLLSVNGKMIHNCPNYAIPFEPHYGIPLIPFFPATTGRFLPQSIREDGCWKSLNFVTASQIKKVAKSVSAKVYFKKHLIFEAFARLNKDIEFKRKHPVLGAVAFCLQRVGLLSILKLLPTAFSTPMIFEWRRAELDEVFD